MKKELKVFSQIIKIISVITLMACLALSCSPERRLSRMLEKHPELLKSDTTDSTKVIITPGAKSGIGLTDDQLKGSSKENPIQVDSNGVKTTIYHEYNKTYINSECPPNKTIYRDRYINNKLQITSHYSTRTPWWIFICCGLSSWIGGFSFLFLTKLFNCAKV